MALTRDFKETIQARVQRDPEYRKQLFLEALNLYVSGEVETSNTLLRDYINATVGFEKLGKETHKSPKSLMRMFSKKGNPRAKNLFGVIVYLQKKEGLHLRLSPVHPRDVKFKETHRMNTQPPDDYDNKPPRKPIKRPRKGTSGRGKRYSTRRNSRRSMSR